MLDLFSFAIGISSGFVVSTVVSLFRTRQSRAGHRKTLVVQTANALITRWGSGAETRCLEPWPHTDLVPKSLRKHRFEVLQEIQKQREQKLLLRELNL